MRTIQRRPPRQQRHAVTLVELVTVIAIMGILVSALMPALQWAREAARGMRCRSNLRQIGIATLNYESAHSYFPPGQYRERPGVDRFAWTVAITPYIEEDSVWEQIDETKPMVHAVNKGTSDSPGPVTRVIKVYLCPSTADEHVTRREGVFVMGKGNKFDQLKMDNADRLGAIDYMGVSGPHKDAINLWTGVKYGKDAGVLTSVDKDDLAQTRPKPRIKMTHIVDGPLYTILVIECTGRGWEKGSAAAWASGKSIGSVGREQLKGELCAGIGPASINMKPASCAWTNEEPYSEHPGGVNVLMCDGSVGFLSEGVELSVLRAMASRAGNDVRSDARGTGVD